MNKDTLNVFVHLAINKDAIAWREDWRSGRLIGVNEETPYGYGRAESMGCVVKFSRAMPEGILSKIVRLSLRVLTGFDLIHAYRQRSALLEADVVWTHTEAQFLAVAAVLSISKRRPKILGQSVWLFDRWKSLTLAHKILYRFLIRHVDILTVHSSENLTIAKKLFPHKKVVLVPFGIPSEQTITPVVRRNETFNILSIGNDRHRDWACLASAFDNLSHATLTIISGTAPRTLTKNRLHLRITQPRTNDELSLRLSEASVVCVPLKPNYHASGITVIQEAVLAGVPVIATDTGGLDGYFDADLIRYVSPGSPQDLCQAFEEISRDPESAQVRAVKAQQHMIDAEIGAEFFIRRHVELSHEMLERQRVKQR